MSYDSATHHMTFETALVMLRHGTFVRRLPWLDRYIVLTPIGKGKADLFMVYPKGNVMPWDVLRADLLAEDWVEHG